MATNGVTDIGSPHSLPSAASIRVSPHVVVQPPLSRLGRGPGLVLVLGDDLASADSTNKSLDPTPLHKWAEEGYAVAEITVSRTSAFDNDLADAVNALKGLAEFDGNEKLGLVSYLTKSSPHSLSNIIDSISELVAIVSYGEHHPTVNSRHLLHVATGSDITQVKASAKIHSYPTSEPFFVLPSHPHFNSAAAAISHTRTLTFLKAIMGGPYFDLEAIWEEHTLYEFGERAVEKTMATMVQEPYVNHVPTITGGIGRASLTNFYRDHFIFNNPKDTALELVSRTVGIDRIIDEFVFIFTHDKVIDWLLPGVPPTFKHVRVPFTGVVNVRGDRLYHEHIWWDQASILVQLGLLPEYLPFPYPINGKGPAPGNRFEYRVPAAGAETAEKLADENAVESNLMFDFKVREVKDESLHGNLL